MDLEIRPVEPGDAEDVLRLAPRLMAGVDPSRPAGPVREAVVGWVAESLAAAATEGHAGWVAAVGGRVVGFVSVAEEEHWSGEVDAWVGELVVDAHHERLGIARSLVAQVEGWAVGRGLRRVRLTTGVLNHGALAFYGRLGYQPTEVTLVREPVASSG